MNEYVEANQISDGIRQSHVCVCVQHVVALRLKGYV